MKWNDLAFWKKLSIAFGALLSLSMIGTGLSITGISAIREHSLQTRYLKTIHDLFAENTLDHYRWLTSVNQVLLDGKSGRLDVQTDGHQCKLDQWLYGEERGHAETAIAGLVPLLKKLETPHARLHDSAQTMDRVLAAGGESDRASVTAKGLDIYRKQTLSALEAVEAVWQEIDLLLDHETDLALERSNRKSRATVTSVLVIAALTLVAGILFSVCMTRSITRRIWKLTQSAGLMAQGNFTGRIDIDQKDEIGRLAAALEKTQGGLSRMFGATIDEVVGLSSSSNSLFGVSRQLAEGAEEMTSRANTVAAAAEEMSSNMNSVAAASEQAATSVNMVASAAEEITLTVKEIAGNSEKGRTITNEAVAKAESASLKVNELGAAATQISKVTEAITEISEQTNLLALNATIEAARAGEAGKGFAVVANEIKNLAKQTAEATHDIKAKVEGIQSTTSTTVAEIELITQVIRNVNDIVSAIATAVEEQSISTQEIADNVSQASLGIREVSANVAQSSLVASEIARDIAGVSHISAEIKDSSSRVSGDAGNLSTASGRIKEMMQRFRIDASQLEGTAATLQASDIPDLVRWDNRIQLGIRDMDNQHKRLVDLINSLNRAMKLRKSREALTRIFADLVDYTVHHFSDEENLMRKYDFTGLKDQEAQHRHFAEKMTEMQQQVKTGNTMITMDLMDFLKDWLVRHIQGTDKKYQGFFQSKGVR